MADLGAQLSQLTPEQRQQVMQRAQQEANQGVMQEMMKKMVSTCYDKCTGTSVSLLLKYRINLIAFGDYYDANAHTFFVLLFKHLSLCLIFTGR